MHPAVVGKLSVGEKHKNPSVYLRAKRLSIRDGIMDCPSMWEKVHVLMHLLEDNRRYDVMMKPAKRRIGI